MNTSFFLFNPIFQYDNIVEKYEGDPHGNVSADKFKTDIETLFAEGYRRERKPFNTRTYRDE